jgi:hypothetical protein
MSRTICAKGAVRFGRVDRTASREASRRETRTRVDVDFVINRAAPRDRDG